MSSKTKKNSQNKPLVVFIDDTEDLLEYYRFLLADDYRLETYSTPTAFLDKLKNKTQIIPDVLVVDLNLPEMSGLDLMKKTHDLGINIPFIMLSGFLDKKSTIEAHNIGAFRMIEKTELESIIPAIDELLMENEVVRVRSEIRHLTSQLRELYSGIRLIMEQHIPEEIYRKMVISSQDAKGSDNHSFDEILGQLEARLASLLDSEKLLTAIKQKKAKTGT
jgi:FixJ family two-component response regulator